MCDGEGNVNPLQYSCLEKPMDRGAWRLTVHGVAKIRTRLSNSTPIQRHRIPRKEKCSIDGTNNPLQHMPLVVGFKDLHKYFSLPGEVDRESIILTLQVRKRKCIKSKCAAQGRRKITKGSVRAASSTGTSGRCSFMPASQFKHSLLLRAETLVARKL